MNSIVGPYASVEAAYRRERITQEYNRRHRHPIRALGRAISHVHARWEGV
jgi:hypothetical protein